MLQEIKYFSVHVVDVARIVFNEYWEIVEKLLSHCQPMENAALHTFLNSSTCKRSNSVQFQKVIARDILMSKAVMDRAIAKDSYFLQSVLNDPLQRLVPGMSSQGLLKLSC